MINGSRDNVALTILYRKDVPWEKKEIAALTDLAGQVFFHSKHPDYLVLWGHHTERETLKALRFARVYEVIQVIGMDDERIPFKI